MIFAKSFIGLSMVLLCAVAQSAEVKITSFNFIGYRSSAAELCGSIDGDAGPIAIIDIISDPISKIPGQYSTIASKDGKFCVVINTLTGKADAKLREHSQIVTAQIK
mgnify:CR=1 FL=1